MTNPSDAALGATQGLPDADLPMLAARWLSEGWDSELLVEMAGMSRADARVGARRLLPAVLESLGVEVGDDWRDSPAGRCAAKIGWAMRLVTGGSASPRRTTQVL